MSKPCWFYLFSIIVGFIFSTNLYADNTVILLDIQGVIGPATKMYVQRGLETAVQKKAELVVLRLNTSGGSEMAMRGINQAILSSPIPVAAFVAPNGARTTNVGTFIVYASHVAAMSPGTTLGITPETISPKKITNAGTVIKNLAKLHGRNSQPTAIISAEKALKLHVINFIANDLSDLLKKLNGTTIQIKNVSQSLSTNDVIIENFDPDWRVQFLAFITQPSIAYILLLIGIYALFFEITVPGFILPGLIGIISLLIALYAFQLLPISYFGLTLLLAGIACMVGEVFISSFGIIGICGIVAFVAGSILLLDPEYTLAWSVILTMSLVSIVFIFAILFFAVSAFRRPIVIGREAIVGREGEVLEYHADYVLVRVDGEIWSALSDTPLSSGEKIRVKKISNLILTVEPILKLEK